MDGGVNKTDVNRICDICIYDYWCMKLNRPKKTCRNFVKVKDGKKSEDYAPSRRKY